MDSLNGGTTSSDNSTPVKPDLRALMDTLLAAKAARRKELARLPIQEKIKILVELQKMAAAIPRDAKKTSREPWQVPWNL